MLMKTLNNLAALSLSLILGLMPFGVIALNDIAATRAEVVNVAVLPAGHALGMEGR
jgi:hypothetical protein